MEDRKDEVSLSNPIALNYYSSYGPVWHFVREPSVYFDWAMCQSFSFTLERFDERYRWYRAVLF